MAIPIKVNPKFILLSFIVFLIYGISLYVFAIRPINIREDCRVNSTKIAIESTFGPERAKTDLTDEEKVEDANFIANELFKSCVKLNSYIL